MCSNLDLIGYNFIILNTVLLQDLMKKKTRGKKCTPMQLLEIAAFSHRYYMGVVYSLIPSK